MTTSITKVESPLLFRALLANGVFSTVSGLLLAVLAGPIAELIGLQQVTLLRVIGVGLIGFGASLMLHVRRSRIRGAEAVVISALDLGWVLVSVALVVFAPGLFSTQGIVAILAVAAVVFAFFEMQAVALWKLRRSA